MEKIAAKTGIQSRRLSGNDQFSLDMAICAAKKLLKNTETSSKDIDFILFCTQTPKYLIPTNASLIQEALGLSQKGGALDFNQGCSGYVYLRPL